jgi:hypothetical protein
VTSAQIEVSSNPRGPVDGIRKHAQMLDLENVSQQSQRTCAIS